MEQNDEPSQQKKGFGALINVISMAAMGAGIAAAVIAASKTKAAGTESGRIEKSIIQLNIRFDRVSHQLKSIQPEISATAKEAGKKPEGTQRDKPEDVIYVRKSSDFSFYN